MTQEPGVFEAMALVHSRIRRVVFGIPDKEAGGLGGSHKVMAIHSLPGTNHKYRAFCCGSDSDLYERCLHIYSSSCNEVSSSRNA